MQHNFDIRLVAAHRKSKPHAMVYIVYTPWRISTLEGLNFTNFDLTPVRCALRDNCTKMGFSISALGSSVPVCALWVHKFTYKMLPSTHSFSSLLLRCGSIIISFLLYTTTNYIFFMHFLADIIHFFYSINTNFNYISSLLKLQN